MLSRARKSWLDVWHFSNMKFRNSDILRKQIFSFRSFSITNQYSAYKEMNRCYWRRTFEVRKFNLSLRVFLHLYISEWSTHAWTLTERSSLQRLLQAPSFFHSILKGNFPISWKDYCQLRDNFLIAWNDYCNRYWIEFHLKLWRIYESKFFFISNTL